MNAILNLTGTTLRNFHIDEQKLLEIEKGMLSDKIRLFQVLDAVICAKHTSNHAILNFKVMQLAFGIYEGHQNLTKEQTGKKISRTGEIVRKILISLEEDFNKLFHFVQSLNYADNLHEKEFQSKIFITLNDDYCKKLNEFNSTRFSQKFITRILGLLLHDTHYFVGSNSDENWVKGYLIDRRLMDFNFFKFICELRKTISPNNPIRKNDFIWTYDKILGKYANGQLTEIRKEIIDCCEQLIYHEFEELMTDETGVIIPRNSKKTIPEYLDEAFDSLGFDRRGHTTDDVYDQLKDMYPNQQWNKTSIASYLSSSSGAFRALGKKSSFVRKKWIDDGADIILGSIPEAAAEIVRKSVLPISIFELTETLAYYRRDMNVKSVKSHIGQKTKNRENFYGDRDNHTHNEFLSKLRTGNGSAANWRRYEGMQIEAVQEDLISRNYPVQQIDYLFKLKIKERLIEIMNGRLFHTSEVKTGRRIANNPTDNPIQQSKKNRVKQSLIDKLMALENTDDYRPSIVRFEQLLLRSILFYGMKQCECALCGRQFPIRFLAAAHIKKRAKCSEEERRDHNIVMPACIFGCDALFERGFLSVDRLGIVRPLRLVKDADEIVNYIDRLAGRKCSFFKNSNKGYFEAHICSHK